MEVSRSVAILVVIVFLVQSVLVAAVRGTDVMYVGGTIQTVAEGTKGKLNTKDSSALIFNSKSKKGSFQIPYKNITSLEYGQKAGRRVGVAIVITVWALFSKKRKHFLTIGFKDEEGNPQGEVIELPKRGVRSTILVIEVRSGQKVEYQSEEAKKHVFG